MAKRWRLEGNRSAPAVEPAPPRVRGTDLHASFLRGRRRALRHERAYIDAVRKVFDAEAREVARRFRETAVPHAIRAAADNPSATMVAVYPSLEQATALAQPNGEPIEILHCTLAFLGDTTVDQLETVAALLRQVAGELGPLEGAIGGIASFGSEDGDEPSYPSVALPDVPYLADLRAGVTEALREAGVEYANNHGWTPHITLSYSTEPSPPPATLLGLPVTFDALYVTRGDIPRGYPFGEALSAAGEPPEWSPPHADEVFDPEKFADKVRKKTDPIRQATIEAATAEGLSLAGLDFDATNPLVAGVLDRVGGKVTYISDTTRAGIMRTIDYAYQQGLSIPDTAKLLQTGMEDASEARATMIARTEMAGLVNGGDVAATRLVANETGTLYEKQWLTADGAEYPRHELYDGLDGQTVGLEEYFDVGGDSLAYPGDPDGSPEETINCRCTVIMLDQGGGATGEELEAD